MLEKRLRISNFKLHPDKNFFLPRNANKKLRPACNSQDILLPAKPGNRTRTQNSKPRKLFLPDAPRVGLAVGRVLRLARDVPAIVLQLGREPEHGDRLEALAVGHQLGDRLHTLLDRLLELVVEPRDLEREREKVTLADFSLLPKCQGRTGGGYSDISAVPSICRGN